MTPQPVRVLFRVEVKDCVLPRAPAALINAPLSICFEQHHKLAATSDRSLLIKAGEDPRVQSFPRETLALVLAVNRDARGKYVACTGRIVVRMRRKGAETRFKGLAIAELALHQILASSESTGGVSGEIKVPLTRCPWQLTAAEAKKAFIIVTVTSRVIGEVTPGEGEGGGQEEAPAAADDVTSADFGYDSDDDVLSQQSQQQQQQQQQQLASSSAATARGSGTAQGLESAVPGKSPNGSSTPGSMSPSRIKGNNPYAAAINAAVSSTSAFKRKCDSMSGELRVLKREYEESSKLKQALRALQSKFDAASRDLAEQAEVVSMQAGALKSKSGPEVWANLSAQLASRDEVVARLKAELEAVRKGKGPGAPAAAAADPLEVSRLKATVRDLELQLSGATFAKDQAVRDKDRASQELEDAKRTAEEASLSLLKTRHQFAGCPSKAQVSLLSSDLEMTKAQLKASLDLIDALMQLQPTPGSSEASAGGSAVALTESGLRAILTAASSRGKELADVAQARDELQVKVDSLTRQLMATTRKQAVTYGSVVNPKQQSLADGWGEAQFSDWTEQEAVTRAEADTASIFLPEDLALSHGAGGDASEELLALESKLQTCSAQLRLKETQLASTKASLEDSKKAQDKLKLEVSELTQKMQSGLAFISGFEAQVSQAKAATKDLQLKLQQAQQQLFETQQELESARSRSAKLSPFTPSSGPPPQGSPLMSPDGPALVVAEYEEKLQQASEYLAWQEAELTKERERVGVLERKSRELNAALHEAETRLAEVSASGGGGGLRSSGVFASSASLGGFSSDDVEGQLREAQDKNRVLKRDSERQKLELDELRDLLEVRDEHIRSQQKKLRALQGGSLSAGGGNGAGFDMEESYEAKGGDRGGGGGGGGGRESNRRLTELEDQLNATLLKTRAQEDKLTKAAEYIKYQKEQLTAYMDQMTAVTGEAAMLREQLEAIPPPQEGPTAAELELQAEVDEVRRFAEEFETKLVEAAEFIDQQAAEITALHAALEKERRDRIASISTKASLTEMPKQPALPYLNSRNDPENIDFDECMDYLRKIDTEVGRARKQEVTLAGENLQLQASLKQALAAAAANAVPIYQAPASAVASGGGGDVSAQVKEARDVAKKLAQEKAQLEATVAQLREQVKTGAVSGGGGSGGGSSRSGAKYDDFDSIVNDLINKKMELSAVQAELEESQRKNREAADALRRVSKLEDELSAVKTAKTLLEKQLAEGVSRNPFDDASLGAGSETMRGATGAAAPRGSLGGSSDMEPLVIEAREVAKKYFGELQAAKVQISALTAELAAAKVVGGVSRKGSITPGVGPLSDEEREALVRELIDTKMQIDALSEELEDERVKSADLVSRLNESTRKIASLEAKSGHSAGSSEPSRGKGISKFAGKK